MLRPQNMRWIQSIVILLAVAGAQDLRLYNRHKHWERLYYQPYGGSEHFIPHGATDKTPATTIFHRHLGSNTEHEFVLVNAGATVTLLAPEQTHVSGWRYTVPVPKYVDASGATLTLPSNLWAGQNVTLIVTARLERLEDVVTRITLPYQLYGNRKYEWTSHVTGLGMIALRKGFDIPFQWQGLPSLPTHDGLISAENFGVPRTAEYIIFNRLPAPMTVQDATVVPREGSNGAWNRYNLPASQWKDSAGNLIEGLPTIPAWGNATWIVYHYLDSTAGHREADMKIYHSLGHLFPNPFPFRQRIQHGDHQISLSNNDSPVNFGAVHPIENSQGLTYWKSQSYKQYPTSDFRIRNVPFYRHPGFILWVSPPAWEDAPPEAYNMTAANETLEVGGTLVPDVEDGESLMRIQFTPRERSDCGQEFPAVHITFKTWVYQASQLTRRFGVQQTAIWPKFDNVGPGACGDSIATIPEGSQCVDPAECPGQVFPPTEVNEPHSSYIYSELSFSARQDTNSSCGAYSPELTIVGATFSGPHADDFRAYRWDFPAVADANGCATFKLRFNPQARGLRTATVHVQTNDMLKWDYSFTVSGLGYVAEPSIETPTGTVITSGTAASLELGTLFPDTLINVQRRSTELRLYNRGDGHLTVGSVRFAYTPPPAQYEIEWTPVPSGIPAGEYRPIVIWFKPTSTGLKSVTLNVNAGVPLTTFSIPIAGNATSYPVAELYFNGTRIPNAQTTTSTEDGTNFGIVPMEEGEVTRNFTLRNAGSEMLAVVNVSVSGSDAAYFAPEIAADTVEPTAEVDLSVRFNPGIEGATRGMKEATISWLSNDPNVPAFSFAVAGTVAAPSIRILGNGVQIVSGATASSDADGTALGDIAANDSFKEAAFIIKNEGTAPLAVSSCDLSGSNMQGFIVSECPTTAIAAGGAGSLVVRFQLEPSALGAREATVTVSSNSLEDPTFSFHVTANGLASLLKLQGKGVEIANGTTDASEADGTAWGDVTSHEGYRDAAFSVTNEGSQPLVIAGCTVSGANAEGFTITGCPSVVDPSGTADVMVRFHPNTFGTREATVTITSNTLGGPTFTFVVTGNGVGPCPSSCQTCSVFTECTACPEGLALRSGSCCHETCGACNFGETGANQCIACAEGQSLVDGQCVSCHASCASCVDTSSCASCPSGLVMRSGSCCHGSCAACAFGQVGSTQCTACGEGEVLTDGQCVPEGADGTGIEVGFVLDPPNGTETQARKARLSLHGLRLSSVKLQAGGSVITKWRSDVEAFKTALAADLAAALGVAESRVEVSDVHFDQPKPGQVQVTTRIAPDANGIQEFSAASLVSALEEQLASPESPLRSGTVTAHMSAEAGLEVKALPAQRCPDGTFRVDCAAGLPGAPTDVLVTVGEVSSTAELIVAFTAPTRNAPMLDYTAVCTVYNTQPDGASSWQSTGASSPVVVSVPTKNTYWCTVRARNAMGTSANSAFSAAVEVGGGTGNGGSGSSSSKGFITDDMGESIGILIVILLVCLGAIGALLWYFKPWNKLCASKGKAPQFTDTFDTAEMTGVALQT